MERSGPSSTLLVALFAGAAGALLTLWVMPRVPMQSVPDPQDRQLAVQSRRLGSMSGAVERAAPAVVSIFAARIIDEPTAKRPVPGFPYRAAAPLPHRRARELGVGSGVILSAGGIILTNRHVVADAQRIEVLLADGRRLPVRLLGVDRETDLAVLKADATGLPTISIGDPKSLRVGDITLAIGNPYGVGQTVTQGIVSAIGRSELGLTPIEDFIQTDAAINPGNSGGALVNDQGDLVGINTAIYSESGTSDGIGFAIPADMAVKVARAIVSRGEVSRGWIGMSGRSVTPALGEQFGLRAERGVLVSSTLRDSPAERAGLRPGDVVTRVGGRAVETVQDLLDAVAGSGPNQPILLEVWRGSERLIAQTVTGRRPAKED